MVVTNVPIKKIRLGGRRWAIETAENIPVANQKYQYVLAVSWKLTKIFFICFILNIQYSLKVASPLIGPSVQVAPLEHFPFIVSLTDRSVLLMCGDNVEMAHHCGGSLITIHHVLTAAHCLSAFAHFQDVLVKIESTDLRARNNFHTASWWCTFVEYCEVFQTTSQLCNGTRTELSDENYDIAIMKLTEPVRENFPLPTISYIPTSQLYGKPAVMGGWGLIPEIGDPRNMRIETATILQPEGCTYQEEWEKEDTELCTDASMAHTTPGDSGGPILYDALNLDYPNNIVGVMVDSFERNGTVIDVHASVYFYREFIEYMKTVTTD